MTKRISTYDELLEEKARLEKLFKEQKAIIREDFDKIGAEFEPVKSAIQFAGKFVTRDGGNFFLNASANGLINILVKRLLLSRTGWFTRLVVPFLLKNYSSHFISENKDNILRKIMSWIRRKHANGQEHVHEG